MSAKTSLPVEFRTIPNGQPFVKRLNLQVKYDQTTGNPSFEKAQAGDPLTSATIVFRDGSFRMKADSGAAPELEVRVIGT